MRMQRRHFLKNAAAALAALGLPALPQWALAAKAVGLRRLGQPQAFDYGWLKGQARALATVPYKSHKQLLPGSLEALNWDQYQSIRYRQDHALWADGNGKFQAKFFHLGLYFHTPVHIYDIVDGQAQQLAYDPAAFDYGSSGLGGKQLPKDLGFAGFRLNTRKDTDRDFSAFLGASYFRAVGKEGQYGQSARGLAIDTGTGGPEEFPDFIAYYLEQPADDSNTVVVYGLLDSPSVAGAYRFAITNGEVLVMEIDSALYPRKTIERLGIGPCTSMYQVGENDRRMDWDWRPEIHDTDGLAMWTGGGEWIWRPLCNPPQLRFNMFVDENPRGFGLLQRDRNFDHYQDDGVFYEKRLPVGGTQERLGQGLGATGRDSDRGRDLRQHRGVLESAGQAAAGARVADGVPVVLGRASAGQLAAGALRGHAHRPGRHRRAEAQPFLVAVCGGFCRWRTGCVGQGPQSQGRGHPPGVAWQHRDRVGASAA